MRENAATKARRYLCEGRVVVTGVAPNRVEARVRGDGTFHACHYRGGDSDRPCRTFSGMKFIVLILATAADE